MRGRILQELSMILTAIGVVLGIGTYYLVYCLLSRRAEDKKTVNLIVAGFVSSVIAAVFVGISIALVLGAAY